MVFSTVVGVVRGAVSARWDGDGVDRLSYLHTTSLLLAASVVVSFKLFGGRPLECWAPAHFTDPWIDYAETFCWAKNTYTVPDGQPIGQEGRRDAASAEAQTEAPTRTLVSYYQWVPFFFLAQAAAFQLPSLLWQSLSSLSAFRLHSLVGSAVSAAEGDLSGLEGVAERVRLVLAHQEGRRRRGEAKGRCGWLRPQWLRRLGLRRNFLALAYLLTKALYAANALANCLLLNAFLQTDAYDVYGLGALWDLLKGESWRDSHNFPRVSLCDFNVRVLGAVQSYTVQCVLVINIINEKLFLVLWLTFTGLFVVTMASLVAWAGRLLGGGGVGRADGEVDEEASDAALSPDLRLLLRLVEVHAGSVAAAALRARLGDLDDLPEPPPSLRRPSGTDNPALHLQSSQLLTAGEKQ